MHAEQYYRERRPAAVLAERVACVWIQSVSPRSVSYVHRTVPNGSVELTCVVGSLPHVSGPRTRAAVDVLAPAATLVGVRFRPGAAPALLGLPASALVDGSVAVDELWGSAAIAVGERIAKARSAWDAAALLEAAVAARLPHAQRPDALIAEAVRRLLPWGTHEVITLTSSLSISERQLRRRFRDAIGLAPKEVQRVLRFQGFLALAHDRPPAERALARLAAEAGYADQSHLTRESLRLSGLTPRALLRETAQHCGPTHDHLPSFEPLLRRRALA
jgi:AraC-like DNA-binding protein